MSLTILLVSVFLLSALAGVGKSAIAYTQYTGTLDGAGWELRIPDPWNGMLLVCCRAYSRSTTIPSPSTGISSFEVRQILDAGFAVAASNYGATGLCILEGVESTYELTTYLIENYGVTGKVFLVGWSMGGAVALLLGEKYPDVYSGVLDMYGIKDLKDAYRFGSRWANLSDIELAAELTALGIPVPPPGYSLAALRNFNVMATADTELATGGTPLTRPKAYEDRSPTYHANIQIPVITVHGNADPIVYYHQSLMYKDAVAKAYRSDLYRLYTIPGAGHATGIPATELPTHFNELVEWSNELTGSSDWPMFHQNPQHTGYSASNAPNTNQTLWTNTIGVGSGSHPAVADGKVYVAAYDNNTYCFDAATGAKIWNYSTGGALLCNPAVADGRVYVSSMDSSFYCLDALTGVKIWSYKTGGVPGSGPVVSGGKVYVGADDGKLYCLRADWGQVEWIFTTGGSVLFAAVADGKVYFGSFDKKVYCVGASTGALIWSYTTGDEVWDSPAVADGRVYVGSYDNNVYCLSAATGAKIWSYATGGDVYSSPAVAYGKLYVGSMDNKVYCLDAATGTSIWNYSTAGRVYGSPTVADGKVYVGSWDRNIYCLDAATGAMVWSYGTGGQVTGSPVVANGVAYAVSGDRVVYAFSPWAPVPEGLTIQVMLALSIIAAIVSARCFRKRPKWAK